MSLAEYLAEYLAKNYLTADQPPTEQIEDAA
jgi:hypothetical protein